MITLSPEAGLERPVYFLSDLHLNAASGARTEAVLRFLSARQGEAEAVFLVGDVFDFWLGHRHALYSAFLPMLRQLDRLVHSGTQVILFSGNHDPDPGPQLRDWGVQVHEQALEMQLAGQRLRIEHGDLADPRGLPYRLPCLIARNRGVRALARQLPVDALWRLTRAYAHRADDPPQYDPLPEGLKTRSLGRHRDAGVDLWILGHYHRAVDHTSPPGPDGRTARLFVLGDWLAHRSYLKVQHQQFGLWRDRFPLSDQRIPPGDHAPDV